MKILFVSGTKHSGKTPTCIQLDKQFILKFKKSQQSFKYQNSSDFVNFYTGKTNKGQPVTVILNSACDLVCIIEQFIEALKNFLNSTEFHKTSVIILITAIRNQGDKIRQKMEDELKNIFLETEIIEIPLSRINEKSDKAIHQWYHLKMNELIKHTLKNPPFELL